MGGAGRQRTEPAVNGPLTTGRSVILQNTQMASPLLGGGEGNKHFYSLFWRGGGTLSPQTAKGVQVTLYSSFSRYFVLTLRLP